MMENKCREKNLPNRKRIRLEGYDYSTPGNYFITIVVHDRLCLFGHVADGNMVLNEAGLCIEGDLAALENVYPGVLLLHYVVMPNHIHFVITLTGDVYLSEVIRRFKSHTTHLYIEGVKRNGWMPFQKKLWQHNYYEHIIRNQRAHDFIANYIHTNPQRWAKDAINPNHDADKDEIMKQVLSYG